MDQSGFMHKYYDWAEFEKFIHDIHAGDGDVVVIPNVTEIDRSGAKRQTDVKIIRRTAMYTYTTLVECKRWKKPVGRDRIDVLASSILELGATNGAIFTTVGFEAGAVSYAKSKNIELYLVRDLTEKEWGAPGRHIALQLHTASGEFNNMAFDALATPLVDDPPTALELHIELLPDQALDPGLDLFSVKSGERGPNLVSLLSDAHRTLLRFISNGRVAAHWPHPEPLQVQARAELDLRGTEFCQLRLPKVAVRFNRIGFVFCAQVTRSAIEIDRGANLDFAVMIESFVSENRLLVHRAAGETTVRLQEHESSSEREMNSEDVLQNGAIFRMQCSPWTALASGPARQVTVLDKLLRVSVSTDGATPKFTFSALPLDSSKS